MTLTLSMAVILVLATAALCALCYRLGHQTGTKAHRAAHTSPPGLAFLERLVQHAKNTPTPLMLGVPHDRFEWLLAHGHIHSKQGGEAGPYYHLTQDTEVHPYVDLHGKEEIFVLTSLPQLAHFDRLKTLTDAHTALKAAVQRKD